jgi:O-antigen/teichoic acid export membrane protein
MLLVSMSVNQAWTPMAFSLIKQKAYSKIKQLSIGLFGLFTIVLLGVYFLKDILFNVIIHQSYEEAKLYIPLLLLGFFFQSCYFLAVKYLFYYKKTQTIASITFGGAVLNLILNFFLIQQFQVLGVAYATAITWLIILLVTFIVSKKYFYQVDSSH